VVDQYVDVARAAGGQAHAAEFGLSAGSDDLLAAQELILESKIDGRYVVMNPGGAWASKRWPAGHFAAVCDRLFEAGVGQVLVGGSAPEELEAADQIVSLCGSAKPASLVGKTSIGALIAVIELSAAHLGGDTGSTHIAAALGKPAVGLYSATRPERTCPYGQFERCHYDQAGLERIEPNAVFETLLEALD
jgi:ADP-heptose:LPS heptosyltransferase